MRHNIAFCLTAALLGGCGSHTPANPAGAGLSPMVAMLRGELDAAMQSPANIAAYTAALDLPLADLASSAVTSVSDAAFVFDGISYSGIGSQLQARDLGSFDELSEQFAATGQAFSAFGITDEFSDEDLAAYAAVGNAALDGIVNGHDAIDVEPEVLMQALQVTLMLSGPSPSFGLTADTTAKKSETGAKEAAKVGEGSGTLATCGYFGGGAPNPNYLCAKDAVHGSIVYMMGNKVHDHFKNKDFDLCPSGVTGSSGKAADPWGWDPAKKASCHVGVKVSPELLQTYCGTEDAKTNKPAECQSPAKPATPTPAKDTGAATAPGTPAKGTTK